MFDRRNPYPPVHQRRRVGDACHRRDIRQKFEIIQIDAPEDDALTGRGGKNAYRGVLACVEAYSAELDGCGERPLVHSRRTSNCSAEPGSLD